MKSEDLFKTVEDVKAMLSFCIQDCWFESNENIIKVYYQPLHLPKSLTPVATFYFYKKGKVFGYGDPTFLNMVRLCLDEKDFDIR